MVGWKVRKALQEEEALWRENPVYNVDASVRDGRHSGRTRKAENIESKPRKKPMKITELPA